MGEETHVLQMCMYVCVCLYKYLWTYLFIGPFPPQMEMFYFPDGLKNINSKTKSLFSNWIFNMYERIVNVFTSPSEIWALKKILLDYMTFNFFLSNIFFHILRHAASLFLFLENFQNVVGYVEHDPLISIWLMEKKSKNYFYSLVTQSFIGGLSQLTFH